MAVLWKPTIHRVSSPGLHLPQSQNQGPPARALLPQPLLFLPLYKPRRHAGALARHEQPRRRLPDEQHEPIAGRRRVGHAHVEVMLAAERARDERRGRFGRGVRDDDVDPRERAPRVRVERGPEFVRADEGVWCGTR
jgi:hypothetical protein